MSDLKDFVIERGVLKKYKGQGGDIVVPDGVKTIGANCFSGNKKVSSVALPNSVKIIRGEAFKKCVSLTSIQFPQGMKKIEECAFERCKSLTTITLPDSVTTIGSYAFFNCENITSVVLPKSIEKIGGNVFANCNLRYFYARNLPLEILKQEKLMVPATMGFFEKQEEYTDEGLINEYKKYAFLQKKKLLPLVFEEDLVQGVAFYASEGKITIENFEEEFLAPVQKAKATKCIAFLLNWRREHIPQEKVEKQMEKELAKDPFNATDMKKLWSFIKAEDGTFAIAGYKGDQTVIEIPPRIGKVNVTAISKEAFSPQKSGRLKKQREVLHKLQSITIPDSVLSIGEKAFYGCQNLISITIPDCVTSIGNRAFQLCRRLADEDGFVIVKSVLNDYYGNCSQVIVPEGVTTIGEEAFWWCKNLTSITISDGVTSIGDSAFEGCENLTSITIPDSVKTIGWCAIPNYENLTIHAPAGSYAESYAKENKIRFVAE